MTGIEVQAFENQNNFDFAHIIRNFMSNPTHTIVREVVFELLFGIIVIAQKM